jgi:hypothetical protein
MNAKTFSTPYMVFSSAYGQNLMLSTLAASTLVIPGIVVSSFGTQTLVAIDVQSQMMETSSLMTSTIITSSLITSSIVTNVSNVSSLSASTLSVNSLLASTLSANSLSANSLLASSLVANSLSTTSLSASSLVASTLSTNSLSTNSLSTNSLVASTFSTYAMASQFITVSTITASTILGVTGFGSTGNTGPKGDQGPQGPQGPGGGGGGGSGVLAAMLSQTAQNSVQQVINSPSSLVAVLWPTVDASQSLNTTGLLYSNGSFLNNTTAPLSLLIEYSISLNTSMGGYSAIGIGGNTSVYGGHYNLTNGFSNSYTIMLPASASFAVYYMDNTSVTVQASSRISVSIISGQMGATGPAGSVSTTPVLSVLTGTQVIAPNSLTLVNWATTDVSQSQGTTGLSYSLPTGTFVNSTNGPLTFLVEYSLVLDKTGGGYTVISVNGSTTYGASYNDNVAVRNTFSVILAPNASLGVCYMDNAGVTIQPNGRLVLTLLVSGQQGPTGPNLWKTEGNTVSYTGGNVVIGTTGTQVLYAPSITLLGTISNFSSSPIVVVNSGVPLYTQVLADSTGNVLFQSGVGMWIVTVNATSAVAPGGITLSAFANVSVNPAGNSWANLYGGFSSYSGLALVAGTSTGASGRGIWLYTTNAGASATYVVTFLRLF